MGLQHGMLDQHNSACALRSVLFTVGNVQDLQDVLAPNHQAHSRSNVAAISGNYAVMIRVLKCVYFHRVTSAFIVLSSWMDGSAVLSTHLSMVRNRSGPCANRIQRFHSIDNSVVPDLLPLCPLFVS